MSDLSWDSVLVRSTTPALLEFLRLQFQSLVRNLVSREVRAATSLIISYEPLLQPHEIATFRRVLLAFQIESRLSGPSWQHLLEENDA